MNVIFWAGNGGTFGTGPNGAPNTSVAYQGGGFRLQTPYSPASSMANLTSWTDSIRFQLGASYKGDLINAHADNNGYGFDTYVAYPATAIGVDIPNAAGTGWIAQGLLVPVSGVNTTSWYMLTETVTQGQFDLYLNGAVVASVAIDPTQTPGFIMQDALGLGTGDWGGDGTPKGQLANFSLYNATLSADQVAALYAGSIPASNLPAGSPLTFPPGSRPRRRLDHRRHGERGGHDHQ